MKSKKVAAKDRNWVLVFIASVLIVLGVVLVFLAATNIEILGWWALVIGISGLMIVAASVASIIKNEPSWILLNLILPS